MKYVHRLFLYVLITLGMVAGMVACGDDGNGNGSDGEAEFIDQTLTGTIGGNEWTFDTGIAEVSPFDANELSLTLTSASADDPCTAVLGGDTIIGDVPNEVGLIRFSASQNVTLLEEQGFVNHIATNGALELLSIGESEVTGRLVANVDEDNEVNGNFTLVFCGE